MFLSPLTILKDSIVRDIVAKDYRTSGVFQKYGIEYCCGANWSLETICLMKGIDPEELRDELRKVTRPLQLTSFLPFEQWSIDFLCDYIVNIHHYYLKDTLPKLWPLLDNFVTEHLKRYPGLFQLQESFVKFQTEICPHLLEKEEIVFPYLRQLAHAYEGDESYAGLLVKTLRKPIDKMVENEHELVSQTLYQFRKTTNNYTIPEKACTSHNVIFLKLKELDNDLAQHMHLEHRVLFPKALALEAELLLRYS